MGLTAVGLFPFLEGHSAASRPELSSTADALQIGMAGYTFHNMNIDQSIAILQQVGISALSIKDFHLPLDSSPETIDEVTAKFRSAGIAIYAAGVIYMKTNADVDRAFEYAKKIGVQLIIGSPAYELLPYVEGKTKTYDIRLAIHNHGPEDKLYPGPKDIYERISRMDPGMGICLDIGHALRAGVNPVQAVSDFGNRIFDLHIKDLYEATPTDKPAIVGRGIIDFPGLVTALKKIHYTGRCSIEFELPVKDPVPGIAESVGFFRGVVRTLN